MSITREHLDHIKTLQEAFCEKMSEKYVAGVKEHGGHLKEKSVEWLLLQAIDENIDQFVYLYTAWETLVSGK